MATPYYYYYPLPVGYVESLVVLSLVLILASLISSLIERLRS